MNKGFYKDLNTNFEHACELCEREFSHEELLVMLKNGNIPEKQIAALKFEKIESKEDVKILLSNLTGCDGKIREAVALKVYQILVNNENLRPMFASIEPSVFADATIDINANICRLVVNSVQTLKFDTEFSQKYANYIKGYTLQALDELDKFIFRDKKYVINKQLFKLYWCLESLKYFYEFVEVSLMMDILNRSAAQNEYTVREKAAEIAILSPKFAEVQDLLRQDSNYYVRAVFLNH